MTYEDLLEQMATQGIDYIQVMKRLHLDNGTDAYDKDREFWETRGDLEDLKRALDKDAIDYAPHQTAVPHRSALDEVLYVWDFVNAAQMVCQPRELYEIEAIDIFKHKFPNLYHTMEVWAWG